MKVACIIVTTRREYFHAWPNAPEEVAFLRHPHRHVFHVKLTLPVAHSDREKEFFIVQRWMKQTLDAKVGKEGQSLGSMSCEDIATLVAEEAHKVWETIVECEVWEDGENGARVTVD